MVDDNFNWEESERFASVVSYCVDWALVMTFEMQAIGCVIVFRQKIGNIWSRVDIVDPVSALKRIVTS